MAVRRAACALLFAISAAAIVVPSNESTGLSFRGIIELQTQKGENISRLVPISRGATANINSPLTGNLYYTNVDNTRNLTVQDIAYISCNPDDYPGNIDATRVFQQAYEQNNITAILLYSTASDFCEYTGISTPLQEFRIFSMTHREDSQKVLNETVGLDASAKYPISIARSEGPNDGSGTPRQQANPLGPSPSTAVAMIILYSITGIITALFLVIIITGAIRAHRHPDRYGPRDVLGRPRQSRARGLGRAILDTIPIVKFGQPEPPKPTDVELGSTTEARNADDASAEPRAPTDQAGTETRPADETEVQRTAAVEQQSGIAPALSVAAGAVPSSEGSPDEVLGCSICTDDFEQGQDIRLLPCSHKFHPECVDPWLLNVSGTCPLCRVDLRPENRPRSVDQQDPEMLAPPLQPEVGMSHRRRSALRDILLFRSRPNASTEERISALRRLREQLHNGSGDVASGSSNGSTEDVTAARRSRRLSTRFSGVFSGRTRRTGQEEHPLPADASSIAAQSAPTTQAPPPGSNSNQETDTNRTTS
ncbi:hypothetical protein K505DRAFT_374041 [Melanomma pulvis-pyrius CBS 109.77]|uniref:RING-type domain-containing protein n=1 Tax=Melanomma pulvis-pyrius CBS 109.77 TaxID=1314802 RepID=A0A6A6XFI3_9PLEO|nr:hypothetical protein K505DRAFT_374041 [Melanomma pulvis-pyrius CBS 109.77]